MLCTGSSPSPPLLRSYQAISSVLHRLLFSSCLATRQSRPLRGEQKPPAIRRKIVSCHSIAISRPCSTLGRPLGSPLLIGEMTKDVVAATVVVSSNSSPGNKVAAPYTTTAIAPSAMSLESLSIHPRESRCPWIHACIHTTVPS